MDNLFIEIFDKYHNDVYRLAYSYTLNKEDAEDISQRTFTSLYKNIKKFSTVDENVKKWLFKVASNDSLDLLKSSWIKKRFDTTEIEIKVKDNEKNMDLLNAWKKISKKYRMPIYLYYYEGYSINEIALLLNITESATKLRLKRGKEKLKIEMGDGIDE